MARRNLKGLRYVGLSRSICRIAWRAIWYSGVVTTASTAVNATDDSANSGVAALCTNRRATV